MHHACRGGHVSIVSLLLSQGYTFNDDIITDIFVCDLAFLHKVSLLKLFFFVFFGVFQITICSTNLPFIRHVVAIQFLQGN